MTLNTYQELVSNDPKAASLLLLEKDQEILKLQQHLSNANKALYGRKSEKISVAQQELFSFSHLEESADEAEEASSVVVPEHSRKKQRVRREIPEGTPVRRILHPADSTECSCCGGVLAEIRQEVTKILNYIPASFEVEEHVRPVLVCRGCNLAPITTKLPTGVQLIERSPVGVGVLSTILVSKYQDHLPLYRLETMFNRSGFDIPRQRMCDWLGNLAELLLPLYRELKQEIRSEGYLQADETRILIQDGETKGRCHTGYFWGLLAPPPKNLVYFHYADNRSGEVPKIILDGFQGILQTDLYAGYNQVYVPEHTRRAGCFAHARRKFIEIGKLDTKSNANKALQLIAKLYQAEPKKQSLKGLEEAQQLELILKSRRKHSVPIIEKLYEHLIQWRDRTLPRSPIYGAIQYALSQWEALTLFLQHPEINLDNNLIENQMRPIAVGRKNWLFAGSHEGAMRAAIFFSLINSCRLNKINTWNYFTDILPKLQNSNREQLKDLLPHRWSRSR